MGVGNGAKPIDLVELQAKIAGDPVLRALPSTSGCSVLFEIGSQQFNVRIGPDAGGVLLSGSVTLGDAWDFSIRLSAELWHGFAAAVPMPASTTLQAMIANASTDIVSGDRRTWAQYALFVDRILELAAGRCADSLRPALPSTRRTEGRYVDVTVGDETFALYYESAGQGLPLLCFHTAGADSRQYRYVLEDPEVHDRFRVIAFDLPGHGKSFPSRDWRTKPYALTVDRYVELTFGLMRALAIEQPMLLGCSMGASFALYMAVRHGRRLRGVCAVGGSVGNASRRIRWANHTEVDHSHFLQSWVGGLFAPMSPGGLRDETLWQYAQAGPSIYYGDTYFSGHDLARVWREPDRVACPAYVLSGEYDYSHRPAKTRELAARIGAEFVEMKGMGHFAVCEDPDRFRAYLLPALEALSSTAERSLV